MSPLQIWDGDLSSWDFNYIFNIQWTLAMSKTCGQVLQTLPNWKEDKLCGLSINITNHLHIFPIYHISLLKPFKGDNPVEEVITIPPLTLDAYLVAIPHKILAFRIINRQGRRVEQVLVEWLDLDPNEKAWEDISAISRLAPSTNLEDNVQAVGMGDVTLKLDLVEVIKRLAEDLAIDDPTMEKPNSENEQPLHPSDSQPIRLVRNRKGTHDPNFN